MRRIVIAAPQSGSGKTTLTLGIMAALKKRGLRVAPFKVGPDFIDPGYHRLVTGVPSVNLDGWICDPWFIRTTFARHAAEADIAVIEGVMGLFDGIDGSSDAGSTAQVAKQLGAPVILVVDARSQARSAAALVHGFATFDPEVTVAGVIFNNVASANHELILREALAAASPGITLLGCVPKDPALAIPSRHLGLLTAEDNPLSEAFLANLVRVAEQHLDLETILALGAEAGPLPPVPAAGTPSSCRLAPPPLTGGGRGVGEAANTEIVAPSPSPCPCPTRGEGTSIREEFSGLLAESFTGSDQVRIAVARDAAFCFVYQDNLRLLSECGAELCYFSPLEDRALPERIGGLYLPGGYPELFAEALAGNDPLKEEIRGAIEAGLPVYAECGGFIYLTAGVAAGDATHPFVGIFPVLTRMLPRRKALGYREVELQGESVIGAKGMTARGHEFHYSEMEEMPAGVERLYKVSRKGILIGEEGFRYRNCLASYIHLHFGSSPEIARNFVRRCTAYRQGVSHENAD